MRFYVASPYSTGDKEENVKKAIIYGDWIAAFGHAVYIPVLTHYWDLQCPHPWEFWMKQDEEWLRVCDAVFRVEGESRGADQEVELAKILGKPVFYDIAEVAKLGIVRIASK